MAGNFEAGCVVLDDDNDENVSNDAEDLASSEPPSFAAEEQALTPTDVEWSVAKSLKTHPYVTVLLFMHMNIIYI